MKFILFFSLIFFSLNGFYAQDIIKMEKSGGIYLIPCKVNGLQLKFIFDTGASDVSISLTEALFMLKNGYLKDSDIRGTEYYSIANGEIAEGTKINIQKIEVGKQILYNVEASIVHSTQAPLLFGQSAMERFGKFTMDYGNSNLIIGNSSNLINISNAPNLPNSIKSLRIGNQTWMSENLNVEKFRNGDVIPEAKTNEEWRKASEEKKPVWCYYDNDPINGSKYGKLYNWYAVNDTRGLAPEGWHIPKHTEWETFIYFLGGYKTSGDKIKSVVGWNNSGNGSNSSGFNALPAGYRTVNGYFQNIGDFVRWWSIDNPAARVNDIQWGWGHGVGKNGQDIDNSGRYKGEGYSIRCLKN